MPATATTESQTVRARNARRYSISDAFCPAREDWLASPDGCTDDPFYSPENQAAIVRSLRQLESGLAFRFTPEELGLGE